MFSAWFIYSTETSVDEQQGSASMWFFSWTLRGHKGRWLLMTPPQSSATRPIISLICSFKQLSTSYQKNHGIQFTNRFHEQWAFSCKQLQNIVWYLQRMSIIRTLSVPSKFCGHILMWPVQQQTRGIATPCGPRWDSCSYWEKNRCSCWSVPCTANDDTWWDDASMKYSIEWPVVFGAFITD